MPTYTNWHKWTQGGKAEAVVEDRNIFVCSLCGFLNQNYTFK